MINGGKERGFLVLIAFLIFVGPIGKSAQFPLHVWLPDAMEGPHTGKCPYTCSNNGCSRGLFIARGFILFENVQIVLTAMAYIGGFTAIFAASIALVQNDIKKILAFSTISQLGYMVMAMGLGSLNQECSILQPTLFSRLCCS